MTPLKCNDLDQNGILYIITASCRRLLKGNECLANQETIQNVIGIL